MPILGYLQHVFVSIQANNMSYGYATGLLFTLNCKLLEFSLGDKYSSEEEMVEELAMN